MTKEAIFKISVTNRLTGEITDVEIKGPDAAKNLYLELSASLTAMKKAKERVADYLDIWLADDEQQQFSDGKILRRRQRVIKEYKVETLRRYLDEDQIDVLLKVDTDATKQLVAELMERGELPPDTLKRIEEEATLKASKPYVEIK